MINNNPEQKSVKYKCRVSGRYNSPTGDEVTGCRRAAVQVAPGVARCGVVVVWWCRWSQVWPVCTKKPIRAEIMKAIRLMTSKFDSNIEYR